MARVNMNEEPNRNVKVPMTEPVTSDDAHQRGVSNVLRAVSHDRDPVDAYLSAIKTNDSNKQLAAWNETTVKDRLEIIDQQLGFLPNEAVIGELSSLEHNLRDDTPIQGNYVETIKSLPQSIGASSKTVTKEAVHMQMRETMSEFSPRFQDMTAGDITGSIAGLVLIPKRSGFAYSKLLMDMDFVKNPAEIAFNAADPTNAVLKLRNMFWGLDDEGKTQFMSLLAEHLPNASDNPFIRNEIAESILGGNFNSGLSHIFQNLDNIDFTLLTRAAFKVGISVPKLLKLRKLNNQLKTEADKILEKKVEEAVQAAGGKLGKTGVDINSPEIKESVSALSRGMAKAGTILNSLRRTDPDLAAELIVKAVRSPEAATKIGVTQASISDAINPLIHGDVGTLLTGIPDDLAASTAKMILMQEAKFEAITNTINRQGILDRDTMADVMKAAEIQQLSLPGVIEANVSFLDETGFRLDWTEAYLDSIGRFRKRKPKQKIVDFVLSDRVSKKNRFDTMEEARLSKLKEPGVTSASVQQIDNKSFKLEFTTGTASKKHENVLFTTNEKGELRAPVEEWVDKGLTTLDPNSRMKGSIRQVYVTEVESTALNQERTAHLLNGMVRDAFKTLPKSWSWTGFNGRKAAAKVDHALQHGARKGKTYTAAQLMDGITGRDFSANEAKAYIGVRNVMEKLLRLKNKQIVDTLLAKNIKLYDGVEGVLPVRNYQTWQAGSTAWKQVGADSHHILVPDGGLSLKGVELVEGLLPLKSKAGLSKEMLKEAYDKGYILARNFSANGLFKRNEIKTQWAFIKANKVVSPRGQQVLHRIEGYMPKQRTNSFWFIKKNKNIGLSGAPEHRALSTEAWSDTEEGAKAWIAKQDNPDDYKPVFDRQIPEVQRMHDVAGISGGMYSGARKSSELRFVGDGDGEFADSFEALQHYINHIGRQYPASLYRIGAEERLLDIARDLGVSSANMSLHNVLNVAADTMDKTSRNFKMLKGIQNQLSFVNMVPTEAEANMATRLKNIGRMFEGPILNKIPGWDKVPKFFYQQAAKNLQPQDLIRGVTFHHLLGMYNPVQLYIQYSGALVSFSIDPINAPKHISKQIGWTIMDTYATDPVAQKKMFGWFKANGLEDYVGANEYELWSNSGMRESVVKGNASYTSVFTKNLPYDAGLLRKATTNHLFFYQMGELANTRMAFATAITRFKNKKGVTKIDPKDPETMEEVKKLTQQLMLNMNRANQSALNKGMLTVPFQFQQIISKYFEKVLPQVVGGTDEFTSWEKARLAIIPTTATGISGVPAGEWILDRILNRFGINADDLSEEETIAARGGVFAYISGPMLGFNNEIASRMSLPSDILESIFDSITHARPTWKWAGPAANVADRYWRNGEFIYEAFDLINPVNTDMSSDDVLAMLAIVKEVALDIPSVTRNFRTYSSHILTDNPSFIKEGKYLWDWETMTKRTAIFAAAGFAPSESTDMYEANNTLTDSSIEFSTFGDADADVILRIMNTKLLTGKDIKDSSLYAKMISSMVHKYGAIEQQKLMKKIKDKTFKKKFDQNNLLFKWTVETNARAEKNLHTFNATLARKRAEKQ